MSPVGIEMKKFIRSGFFIPFVLIVLTFITYINILPNKLFFDDEELIYKNIYVQDLKYFPLYFTSNMIAGAGKISNMYRPILTFSFALDHLFWGNNPAGYHLTSIILHALNGVLIFYIASTLLTKKLPAVLTSILFIVHPVQSEAIIYASGRTDPLYVFFALISIYFFLLFLKGISSKYFLYFLSCLSFLFSLFSKETAIAIPFLLTLIVITVRHSKEKQLGKIIFALVSFFLFDLVYIVLRLTILNFSDTLNFYSNLSPSTQYLSYSQNILVRFYTFTNAFWEYMLLFIFPRTLAIARTMTVHDTFLNPATLAFVIAIIPVTILSMILWKKNNILLFSLLWFFLLILPVSGIIPINNIIAEHYLYLPSFAIFLVFSCFIDWVIAKSPAVKYFEICLFSIMVILFEIRVIRRTFDWRDPITFYTISLRQSPWNIPMRNNLAMAYADNRQLELSIKEYKEIIASSDVYPNVHHNLATSYKEMGKYKEAEDEYKKALKMDPRFYFSYYGLADLYKITGEKDKLDEVLKIINSMQ